MNASAPYVSVHEPLLYSRKNRLIKRQLVDLRYSLCLRGDWLSRSLSPSLRHAPALLPSVFSAAPFSPPCSPASTRLTCLSPSLPRRPSFLPLSLAFLFLRAVCFAGVHRCQLSRIIIHSERMWFPFQITKYGASAHCALHTSFGCSLFSFLPRFRPGSTSPIFQRSASSPEIYARLYRSALAAPTILSSRFSSFQLFHILRKYTNAI